MARLRLIPTEATPVGTPEPESRIRKARAVAVSNGFLAVPVAVSSEVNRLQETTHWIYLRRKDQEEESSSSNDAAIFAVNLPYDSTPETIKAGIEEILRVRSRARKGKGKATADSEHTVKGVDVVQPPLAGRLQTSLLEHEGIYHPSVLLPPSVTTDDESKGKNKKKRKAQEVEPQQQAPAIHPLFVSTDVSTQEALAHLRPSSSTLKAHIVLGSVQAVSTLLSSSLGSLPLPTWPSEDSEADGELSFISIGSNANSKQKKRSTVLSLDEKLYDISRPSLSSVKVHVDEWMALFDASHPKASSSSAPATATTPVSKSKRAEKREAAARAKALAELQRDKAIKKRRAYDDDFLAPEVDAEGWTTVARGGKYGRSALSDGEEDGEEGGIVVEDEEEIRAAQREGYASGKRSVGVASKDFVRQAEEKVKAERARELAALNAKVGITGMAGQDEQTKMAMEESLNESRGSGRGKKKKGTRGIETAMYGHQKREEAKKSMSQLRQRFEQDKKRIEDMKRQKRFRPY